MTLQTKRFVKGAMLLSVAGLIAKIISAFYRIPLANLTGDEGVGYYQTVYPIYSLLVSASMIGIPNAVSKLISEKVAKRSYHEAYMVFKYSLITITVLGFIISAFMLLSAEKLIQIGGWSEGTKYVIWGLSISPIFVSVAGAFKGYFQGMQRMVPTAITQVVENITKVFIGIALTYALIKMGYGIPMAVGGAALGTTFGFVLSTLFIVIYYFKKRKELLISDTIDYAEKRFDKLQFAKIMRKLIIIAIPITVGSAAYSIMNFIDSITVYKRLALVGRDSYYATSMMGQIGKAFSVVNVPLTISIALMISILPAVSEAVARKDKKELQSKINLGIRFSLVLALPSSVGLCILAEPIMKLLYPANYLGYEYLILYGVCLIFMILGQSLASILQGLGYYYFPLVSLLIGVIVKIIINNTLIASPLEGKGAIIGSIAYYMIFVLLNYVAVKKYTQLKTNKLNTVIKPLLATCIMAVVVFSGYNLILNLTNSNTLSTLASVLIGAIIYVMMLLITKALYEDDLAFIPGSNKIVKFLRKLNFIN